MEETSDISNSSWAAQKNTQMHYIM